MPAGNGVNAEATAHEDLTSTYRRFMSEGNVELKNEAGKDLIRAIFGETAIVEDSIR